MAHGWHEVVIESPDHLQRLTELQPDQVALVLQAYQERFANGEDVSRKLLMDLKVWLTNHIQRDDMDYAPFVREFDDVSWGKRMFRKFFG